MMMVKSMSNHSLLPSMSRLYSLFSIDLSKGVLVHKKKFGVMAGSAAGNVMPSGYVRVKIDGKLYLAHRVIYKMVTGEDPCEHEIDHIDGDKRNNRPENLRLATRHQNRQNVGTYKNNKSKLRGVWYEKSRKCFLCSVQSFGNRETFGPFSTAEEASEVYESVSRERFGEFYKELAQ